MRRRSLLLAASLILGLAAAGAGSFFLFYGTNLAAEPDSGAFAPGFVGTSEFGDWALICVPAAESGLARDSFEVPDPAQAPAVESACRIRHEATAPSDNGGGSGAPPRVILTVSLSLVGPAQNPALMLRLPPILSAGEPITIRSPEDFAFEIPARDCSQEECIAAGSMTAEEWDDLIDADALQIVFPIEDGQLVSVDVSTTGFAAAVAALMSMHAAAP